MQSGQDPVRIRIVHLSSVHPADDVRIVWKECASLAQAGYQVAFVVPADRSAHHTGPGQAVSIVTVKRHPSRLGRISLSNAAVLVAGLRLHGHVYHFHDPELIPVGLILRLLGKRVIYDAHEDMSQNLSNRRWIPRPLRYPATLAARGAEWLAGRLLSAVVAATPVIARRFPDARVTLVQNLARLSEFPLTGHPFETRPFAAAYVGALGPSRCAVEMVEALAKVSGCPDPRLIMAGDMSPLSLADTLAGSAGWRYVDYRGRQDRAGVRAILGEARVGLALYYPVKAHIDCEPTKVFEYMAAGLPVITSDFPHFREIVERTGCGLCVPPCDTSRIASAIEWIFTHPAEAQEMGRRGREAAERHFSWASEEQRLLRLYQRVTADLPSNRRGRRPQRQTAGYTNRRGA